MRQFSDIDEVAVIPVKNRVRGEEVKALITLRPGRDATAFDYARLHAHCAEHVASFKIPRYIEIVTAFDHTPSEKIKKNELVAGNWDYTIPGTVETGNDKQT
ncbi:MAG: hypothetical protein CMM46_02775 [Rhodospirillaceae bacterium]|nr:hypothetical protein [Rhodospirillaceae bacterium]|tara:strand:- start:145 stop:450 length:306 start_codon:yes stop_codon:yes gene_type:complete